MYARGQTHVYRKTDRQRDSHAGTLTAIPCTKIKMLDGIKAVFTARRYASAVYAVVVCLSVCPSITRRYCTKTAKLSITQKTLHELDSLGILVFWCQRSGRNCNVVTPTGAQNRGPVGSNWRLSNNTSLYLRNGAR